METGDVEKTIFFSSTTTSFQVRRTPCILCACITLTRTILYNQRLILVKHTNTNERNIYQPFFGKRYLKPTYLVLVFNSILSLNKLHQLLHNFPHGLMVFRQINTCLASFDNGMEVCPLSALQYVYQSCEIMLGFYLVQNVLLSFE